MVAFPTMSSRTAGPGAGRAAPRRHAVALFALALLFLGFAGSASAATGINPPGTWPGCSQTAGVGTWACTNRQEAANLVAAAVHPTGSCNSGNSTYQTATYFVPNPNWYYPDRGSVEKKTNCGAVGPSSYLFYTSASSTAGCPTGTTWDETSKTCFDPSQCLARNAELGSAAGDPRPSLTTSRCVAGCEFKMDTSGPDFTVTDWGGEKLYRGVMEYSGNSCAVSPTVPEGTEEEQKVIPTQECKAIAGQSVCVKPNGQHCYSGKTNSGRQYCWNAGETGEKTDADSLQKRNAGNLPTLPSTNPPENSMFQQDGTPITTTTTTNLTTITTTTTNYVTDTGVDAGTGGGAEPIDGGGVDGGTTGASDAERNSLLGSIRDKLGELLDGWKGDGLDHAADGALSGDTEIWGEGDTVDGSALDTSGMGIAGGACPALWTSGGEGMASWFLIENPAIWCDYVANIKAILILMGVLSGILLVWRD